MDHQTTTIVWIGVMVSYDAVASLSTMVYVTSKIRTAEATWKVLATFFFWSKVLKSEIMRYCKSDFCRPRRCFRFVHHRERYLTLWCQVPSKPLVPCPLPPPHCTGRGGGHSPWQYREYPLLYRTGGTPLGQVRTQTEGSSPHNSHPLNLRSRGAYQFPTLLST